MGDGSGAMNVYTHCMYDLVLVLVKLKLIDADDIGFVGNATVSITYPSSTYGRGCGPDRKIDRHTSYHRGARREREGRGRVRG